MKIEFKLFNCPVDFDTRPYLEISRKEFADIDSEEKLRDVERELTEACTVLANQTNTAAEERKENASVFNLPVCPENLPTIRPVRRLVEMCEKVGDGFIVCIGYKKYEKDDKIYYCPQIRLVEPFDEYGEFTMYDVFKSEITKAGLTMQIHSGADCFFGELLFGYYFGGERRNTQ